MNPDRLQDLIYRGMGRAALQTGQLYDAFRPSGPLTPCAAHNRFLKLRAAFNATDPRFVRANSYGHPVWYGVFDSAYTAPGDYLVEHDTGRCFFIASQPPLLPVVTVLAERTVSLFRPTGPQGFGVQAYGGVELSDATLLLGAWPASMIDGGSGGGARGAGDLPADVRLTAFTLLLPVLPAIVPRVEDLVSDDLGRNFVVSSAEFSELGWRLVVRQVAS
jgi:hypothetical protein